MRPSPFLPRDPLARLALGVVAGLALAHLWPDPHGEVAPVALALLLGVAAAWARLHPLAAVGAGGGAALLLWVVHGGLAPPPAEVAQIPHGRVEITGTVSGLVQREAERQRFVLRTEKLDATPQGIDLGVAVYGAPQAWIEPGARLTFAAALHPPRTYKNPGLFDHRQWRARQGIFWEATATTAHLRLLAPPSRLAPGRLLQHLRDFQRARLNHRFPPEVAALLAALTLGDLSGLAPDLRDAFTDAGLAHLLAISGLHVGLVAGYVFFLAHLAARYLLPLRALAAGRWWAHPQAIAGGCAIGATLLYTAIAGAHVSTLRAAIMVTAALLAPLVGRRSQAARNVALAALALLAVWPQAIGLASFQLSFAAVVAICLVARGRGRATSILGRARLALGITVAAWAATTPLAWLHFGRLAPAGLVTSLVAIPWLGFILLPAALLALALPATLPGVGGAITWATTGAAQVLIATTRWVAAWPFGHLTLAPPAPLWIGLGAVAGWAAWRRRPAGVALAAAVAVGAGVAALRGAPPAAELIALDVGQGDALIVRTVDGHTLLVDGGGTGRGEFDLGREVVVPSLARLGIDHLDVVALTHPQADHMGGLHAVLATLPVGELWDPWRRPINRSHAALWRLAARRGVRLRHPTAGYTARLGDATLRALYPITPANRTTSPNHACQVLRVEVAGRRLLLTGDLERTGEAALIAAAPAALACDLLKVGHHGSRTSSTAPFLTATRPRWLVISVGEASRFGHPHPTVLARLHHLLPAAGLLRTDLDGQLRIHLEVGGGVRIDRHPAPPWVVRWATAPGVEDGSSHDPAVMRTS